MDIIVTHIQRAYRFYTQAVIFIPQSGDQHFWPSFSVCFAAAAFIASKRSRYKGALKYWNTNSSSALLSVFWVNKTLSPSTFTRSGFEAAWKESVSALSFIQTL